MPEEKAVRKSKCSDCPKLQEYIDVGICPECGKSNLLMSTKTYGGVCEICGSIFAVPMSLVGPCESRICPEPYTFFINTGLNLKQLIAFSEMLGISRMQAYHLFKSDIPVEIEIVPQDLICKLESFFYSIGETVSIQPDIRQYHLYEECWGHSISFIELRVRYNR